jgi:RHS repeat-associated protein
MTMKQLSWIWALAILLTPAVAQAQDEVVFYHTDAVGSVRMVTDATGAVIARYDFLPFGELWPTSPPNSNPDARQYTGAERDPETGLDYLGARYLRAQSGLFLTPDPGHVGGDIFNPQSWNAYSYALNNPLRFIDPMGTCSQDAKGNYFDGDDAGTLLAPGPCAINNGALDAGVTETVSVRARPSMAVLAAGIAPWAPVVDGIAIGTGVVVTGGTGLAVLGGGVSSSGAITLGLQNYVPFSLTVAYAVGRANYQVLIQEIQALAVSTAGRVQLTPQQIRALLQNVQDVINKTVQTGRVESLQRVASLERWRFLYQLPPEAQFAFREAMARHGIRIP